jgi:hypothetical protein
MNKQNIMSQISKFITAIILAAVAGLMPIDSRVAMAETQPVPMYRLHNTASGLHLFTIDANERSTLLGNQVWKEESSTFKIYDNCTDGQPDATYYVQRFIANNGMHLLTADQNEIAFLSNNKSSQRWIAEGNPDGFGCVSMTQTAGTVLVYRLYNHVSGEHLLTADNNEVNVLNGKNNWSLEGSAFYAYPGL